jgi:hypothetical protein
MSTDSKHTGKNNKQNWSVYKKTTRKKRGKEYIDLETSSGLLVYHGWKNKFRLNKSCRISDPGKMNVLEKGWNEVYTMKYRAIGLTKRLR